MGPSAADRQVTQGRPREAAALGAQRQDVRQPAEPFRMTQIDQGHSIFKNVFARAEMIGVVDKLAADTLQRTKAGARHLLNVPVVRDLSDDPRMLDIARQFVGPEAVAFRATLFDKSPAANWLVVWHQDTASPAWALERVVALRVSLDDSSMTNGPLRVLPDTHRGGVYSDEQIEQLARSTAPMDCVAPSGSVVAMRPLTIHASSKSSDAQPRRVLHIEYAATINLGSGFELAVA